MCEKGSEQSGQVHARDSPKKKKSSGSNLRALGVRFGSLLDTQGLSELYGTYIDGMSPPLLSLAP